MRKVPAEKRSRTLEGSLVSRRKRRFHQTLHGSEGLCFVGPKSQQKCIFGIYILFELKIGTNTEKKQRETVVENMREI